MPEREESVVSWWLALPAAEFYDAAKAEQPRMAQTKFGRLQTLAQGPDTHQWRPAQKQKQTFGEDYWGI